MSDAICHDPTEIIILFSVQWNFRQAATRDERQRTNGGQLTKDVWVMNAGLFVPENKFPRRSRTCNLLLQSDGAFLSWSISENGD